MAPPSSPTLSDGTGCDPSQPTIVIEEDRISRSGAGV